MNQEIKKQETEEEIDGLDQWTGLDDFASYVGMGVGWMLAFIGIGFAFWLAK